MSVQEKNPLEKISYDLGEKVGEIASNYSKSGKEYVIENPGQSLAMAVGAGALIGSLITLFINRTK